MTQSELARDLRMTQGAVRVNLKELQAIGLLMERDRRYFYNDPVLRYWVAYVQNGIEAPDFPKKKDLLSLIEELDRKYRLVSEELGREKEGMIRELMRLFAGQRVEGKLFGAVGSVALPRFKTIERFVSDDGRTEIDVLARNSMRWAVEVKWKSKAAGEKEVSAFFRKASAIADRCWYVSKAGFTLEAKAFASKKKCFSLRSVISAF